MSMGGVRTLRFLTAVISSFVLAACNSDSASNSSQGSGAVPGQGPDPIDTPALIDGPQSPDLNDPQVPSSPIITGTPVLSGASAALEFDIQEDTQLRAFFYSSENPARGAVTLQTLPQHGRLTLESDGSVFLYTPEENFWGSDGFRYVTFEGLEVSVQIEVEAVNDAPRLSQEIPRVAEQGRLYAVTLDVFDGDEDTLRFNATGLPKWLSLDAVNGILSGTPTQLDIGFVDDITLRVTDSTGLFDELTGVGIEVLDVNDKPTLNLSQVPRQLNARESVSVQVYPDDPDGDPVTLTVDKNKFVSASAQGGTVTLTAENVNDVTEVNLVFKATDRQGGVSREVVTMTLFPMTKSGLGLTLSGSAVGRGVDLVVLGDGYAADQQTLFREHVETLIANMAEDEGIAAHLGAFNIHMIDTVSVDSGSDDNEQVDSRNTAYDSTYGCRELARLICANTLAMFEASLVEYPAVDQIILLVNDRRYGGSGNSGGSVAVTSAYSPEIALHEMGHSLADLADEYVDPQILESPGLVPFEEGRYPNVTAFTSPLDIPWRHWLEDTKTLPSNIGEPGVGLFEGGLYRSEGVFRPTFNSRMRSFDAPFGPVNSERWILRLYTLTEGIRGFSPVVDTIQLVAGESQDFSVSPLFDEKIQAVKWLFNGEDVTDIDDVESLSIAPIVGTHELTMTVSDISGAIRQEPPHAGIFSWTWEIIVK